MTVINDKNGISVIFHFADGHPRPDVSVIVVTTMSKNTKALTNYLFQAVVPQVNNDSNVFNFHCHYNKYFQKI